MIAAEMEEVVDLVVSGEEPLRLAGRFELLHLPLSAARRLVRVFRSVVEPLVLAMLGAVRGVVGIEGGVVSGC